MASNKATIAKSRPALHQKRHLQPAYPSLEGADLTDLERELVQELDPRTAFQRSIAQNIACNEVEMHILRARKNTILWDQAARFMFQHLTPALEDAAAWQLARDWAGQGAEAQAEIVARGIDPELALNATFIETIQISMAIDAQIEQLERRRRKLQEDYNRLKAALKPAPEIEDAQLVTG